MIFDDLLFIGKRFVSGAIKEALKPKPYTPTSRTPKTEYSAEALAIDKAIADIRSISVERVQVSDVMRVMAPWIRNHAKGHTEESTNRYRIRIRDMIKQNLRGPRK